MDKTFTKTKTSKKQKVGCWLGDLAKTKINKQTNKYDAHPKTNNIHEPVLLNEVLNYLEPKPGQSYLDITAGYGGHAEAVMALTKKAKTVLVDRDKQATDYLAKKFKQPDITILKSDSLAACKQLLQKDRSFDMILGDWGVSSPHLNNNNRGFSFSNDGPLDMRMDQDQSLSAEGIINDYTQVDLESILRYYGEEPKAKLIARAIVKQRPINSTKDLADIIAKASGWGRSKVHPATRSFQAIRIAVNDELGQIKQTLPLLIRLLKPGGRIAQISFHSLEDRLVKQVFKEYGGHRYDAIIKILTARPVVATPNEIEFNPRARSAKLRAAVKIKTKSLAPI